MTVLSPIVKRVTPKDKGVRFVGFGHKLYRNMTVYDTQGDNGVDGEDDYCEGVNLTPAQDKVIEEIGSGDLILRVEIDGTITLTNAAGYKRSAT